MDEIVKAAMAKWPNVPACHGWLGLDARGDWYLRDERAQAVGTFAQHKGSRIEHAALREFIGRNYAADERGAWFFQNGPQRVYVELEAAPWVWRLQAHGAEEPPGLQAHTGANATYASALLDEHGRLFVATELGLGLVHSLDMDLAAAAVESGQWQAEEVEFEQLLLRFRYCPSPAAGARSR